MAGTAVAITGGGGRLGSALAARLTGMGYTVTAVDLAFPSWLAGPGSRVHCAQMDVLSGITGDSLRRALDGAQIVYHLAGLHGLHMRRGARIVDVWRSNVEGTGRVATLAASNGARRIILASSTAAYGPGSGPGLPAAILDEAREPAPDNPYATAKLVAESVLSAAAGPAEAISLRLGRFFREDERSYQLRKLSTGLDLDDAIDALAAVGEAARLDSGVYCVASDLRLPRHARAALGQDCRLVLDQYLPDFTNQAEQRGWVLPARVSRSVDSSKLQRATRYRPRRSLAWLLRHWLSAPSQAAGRRAVRDAAGKEPTDDKPAD